MVDTTSPADPHQPVVAADESSFEANAALVTMVANASVVPNLLDESTSPTLSTKLPAGTVSSSDDDDDKETKDEPLKKKTTVERWILPAGAELIVRQMAAEQIVHQLLDCCGCSNSDDNVVVDFKTIVNVVREFPGTCGTWYEFGVDTRDAQHKVRRLLPLHILACLQPPVWAVQAVYEAHPAAISTADPAKGATPLLYACSFEASLEVVQFLMEQHPQAVQQARHDGALPLAMACSYQAPPAVVDVLICQYPDAIRRQSEDGWYPIHAAVACHAPVPTIQRLHQAFGASITDTNNATASTALHLACSKRASYAVVEFLLQVSPASMYAADAKNMTPWFWAVYTQTVDVLRLFMETADIYAADQGPADDADDDNFELPQINNEGISVLHFAARHNSPEAIQFLARTFPALLTARTRHGMTPLHTACRRGRSLAVIRALVEAHAPCLLLKNARNKTPVDEATDHYKAAVALSSPFAVQQEAVVQYLQDATAQAARDAQQRPWYRW